VRTERERDETPSNQQIGAEEAGKETTATFVESGARRVVDEQNVAV